MKKKHLKKLIAIVAAAGMTALTFGVSASASEEASEGYVYVAVEKFSIGQGYVFTPKKVPLYESDRGLDVMMRACGEENVIVTSGDWGSYISGFSDSSTDEVALPDCIAEEVDVSSLYGRNTEGALSEFDYTSEGGFIFLLNSASAAEGIDTYDPSDGDVIRIAFSIYGYGSDIGCDNSAWGGFPSLTGDVDRNEATVALAQGAEKGIDVSEEIKIISDLDSTQEDIDSAADAINEKLYPKTESGNDSTPQTGLVTGLLIPALTASAVLVAKRKKK